MNRCYNVCTEQIFYCASSIRDSAECSKKRRCELSNMILLLQLGVWGKLLVIAIGGSIVVVSVLVAACFLGPGCLGYNYLYRNQLKMKKKPHGVTFGGDFLLSEIGSSSVVTIHNINNSFRRTPVSYRQSVCSTISETSLTSGSNTSYTSIGFMPLPTIVFLLQSVTNPGKLIIFLKHLEGLPAKDFPHHTEVITELKIKSGTTYHWSAISRAIRNTRSPEYDTEFSLPATTTDLQKWCLSITAYDKDRFNGYKELATMDIFLRDFIPALQSGQIIRHASVMTVYKKEYGHLLIGLSYLPTAQRLTISLIRAANLVCLQNSSSERDFKPLARVFLLDGTGKVIQRKKVDELGIPEAARRCSFNTVITMQVTAAQMITATLLIVLGYKSKNGLISPLEDASNSTIEHISRDGYVGRVALGNLVTSVKERKHWQMMQERTRRVVTAWHVLH